MKKLMIAAMMVLSATSAFAGDSDALKAVLKAKTFADAKNLVEQNLGSMANDAEKAKAYNHLVDLAMKQFNDQQSIQQMNQITKKNRSCGYGGNERGCLQCAHRCSGVL